MYAEQSDGPDQARSGRTSTMVQQFQRLETVIGSPSPFGQNKNDELKASKKDYVAIDALPTDGSLAPEFTPTETLVRLVDFSSCCCCCR